MTAIPCAVIRGGTSKGVFVLEDHLPQHPDQRARVLLSLMGSPDPRQVDGLGGADPLTSKVAIVSRSRRAGIDVEYESVEVGIAEAAVNLGIMCGNLLAGVADFAIAEGLVAPQAPVTAVSIYCRSNQKTVVARIPWGEGRQRAAAHAGRDGEVRVDLAFPQPGGAVTGKLLPAGEPVSVLAVGGRQIEVSVVDAGTLYAFARADAFGLTGREDAAVLDADRPFRSAIETAREIVAERINRERFQRVPLISPRLVKLAIVAPPGGANRPDGATVDVEARIINRARVHKAYAVSGGICLAAAAAIPGTVVHAIAAPAGSPFALRIGHPSGVLSLSMRWSADAAGTVIEAVELQRSARIIMRGVAFAPAGGGSAEVSAAAGNAVSAGTSDISI